MNLNPDCVRDILLELEKQPYPTRFSLENLSDALPSYKDEELNYCCLKLLEASLIDANSMNMRKSNGQVITYIFDITYSGHEFLNNIRSDNVWGTVKTVGTKIGAASLNSIMQIANAVIISLINHHLGL